MCLAAAGPVAVAGCQTLALCVGSPGIFKKINSFAVMCRVLSGMSNCHGTITLHITVRRFNELPSVSGLASFLPVPVGGRKLSCHGKAVYV